MAVSWPIKIGVMLTTYKSWDDPPSKDYGVDQLFMFKWDFIP